MIEKRMVLMKKKCMVMHIIFQIETQPFKTKKRVVSEIHPR